MTRIGVPTIAKAAENKLLSVNSTQFDIAEPDDNMLFFEEDFDKPKDKL